jgi:hypothetical protein
LPAITLADDWDLDAVRYCTEADVDALIACIDKREKKLTNSTAKISDLRI